MQNIRRPVSIVFFLLPPLLFSTYTCPRLVEIASQTQFDSAVNNGSTLVAFSADWCGVCKSVKGSFDHVAADPEFNKVTFARVNIDQNPELGKKHNIMGVPTFVYFENGQKITQDVGVADMSNVENILRTSIRTNFHLAQADTQPMDMTQPTEETTTPETPAAEDMAPADTEIAPAPTEEPMVTEEQVTIEQTTEPTTEITPVPETPSAPEPMPEPEKPAETGILGAIKSFIGGIISIITTTIQKIIDAIKSLFGY